MTNRSNFRVGNIGHTCYLAVGAWLSNFCHSNFCHSFWNPLGTFSSKMESLQKRGKIL